ncbi:MAG: twin-arginine translocase TatA/TatE family subunit [Duncaniella sp.]|nr:twin-arginine translocase TatA/TatE family subunit [Duncaniella sp.]MDE5733663.1 twin-arginine translocase TatA/TatE family subunit [Duncaniella sp.]MDE6178314.1 twin-arginine translocase TatA/TatE family subunit [Duncaniella sp.]MDE6390890.1 twin-arginine translocase TatA/TatE family subunit [Duncaniella sp.]
MIPCLFNLGMGEMIVILLVVLLLFGAKRIPELARSLGRGVSQFKQGMNSPLDDVPESKSERSDRDS